MRSATAAQSLQAGGEAAEWLFVHYGDAPLRGSERCLLTLLQSRQAAGAQQWTVLWCNQPSLAEAAAPLVDEVILSDLRLGLGLGGAIASIGAWARQLATGLALVRRRRTQLVYCNGLGASQWMVPVSLIAGAKLLVHLHTNYLPLSRLASMAYGANLLIGVSTFCVRGFASDGVKAARLRVVANGVTTPDVRMPRCAVRTALGVSSSTLLLASVGALVAWKRVDILLAALKALPPHERARVQLLVTGNGPCLESLKAQAQADSLPVIFTGWRTDVGDLLNAADAVVTAAEKEAFGLTIAEGAALGRPALAAAAGGLPDVVVDGHSGLLFKAGSAADCARVIARVLHDPELLRRLGEGARAEYTSRFTADGMSRSVLAIGQELTSAAGHAGRDSAHGGRLRRLACLMRSSFSALWHRLARKHP